MKNNSPGPFVGKSLLLLWAILCIILFINFPGKVSYLYWSNLSEWQALGPKLQRLDLVRYLADLLSSLTGTVVFSLACASLGAFVIGKMKIPSVFHSTTLLTRLALFATGFVVGSGIFSLIFLTISGLYKLTSTYIILLLLVGFSLGARQTKIQIQEIFTQIFSRPQQLSGNRWYRPIILLSASILFLSLLYSTARISYDSSALYFSDAKLTALNNHVTFFTESSFVVSAFQTAIQYTVLIQIFGDQSARMFSWICGIIVIIFSLALGENIGISKGARVILLALLLTSTAFLDLLSDGKVDILVSAPAIAAAYWIAIDGQNKIPIKSVLLLTGFLIGLAIVGRPFNAFILGSFVALFYLQRMFLRKGFEPLSSKLLLNSLSYVAAGAVGLGIYHLFANWIMLGNPLAFVSSITRINPSMGPWNYNPDTILTTRLLYPFVATFHNSPQTLGNISPLVIAFLPLLLVPSLRHNIKLSDKSYVLLFISLITLLLWIFLFFTVYEIRYVLFLWVMIFMPLAQIIATALEENDRIFRNILSAVIIGLLLFISVRTIYLSLDTYSPIDEHGNPQCFCRFLSPINRVASLGDRVLTLTAFRYYLRSDLFACSTKHDEYLQLRTAAQKDSESFWMTVYEQGYKYILYENIYTIRHLEMPFIPSPDNTPEWLELEPIYGAPGDLHIIYLINVKNPPSKTETSCEQNSTGMWEVQTLQK